MNDSVNLTNSSVEPELEESSPLSLIIIVQIGLMTLIVGFNMIIIVLFARMLLNKKKKMKFSDYMFISLTVSDLFVGAFSLSCEMFFTIWPDYWRLGQVACVLFVIIVYAQYTCSFMALLLMSAHRLMQLAFPLRANENLSSFKLVLIALTWLIPYSYYTVLFVVLISVNRYNFAICFPRLSHALVLTTSILLNIMPIGIMIVLNVLAFMFLVKIKKKRAHLNSSKTTKSRNAAATATAIGMQEMNTNMARRIDTFREMTFNKSTWDENTSQTGNGGARSGGKSLRRVNKRFSKDLRASICICVIIANLIATQSIYIVTWPLDYYCRCVYEFLYTFGYWLNYSFSAVNPLVLLIFHEGYRREFRKLFKRKKNTNN
jgi:hypothetical protein